MEGTMLCTHPEVRPRIGIRISRIPFRIPRRARCVPLLGAALLLAAAPSRVRADSDGFFCSGRDYLVLELRDWSTGGPHLVRLARFSRGILEWGGAVELDEDFSVHHLICEENRVRITGAGRPFVAYDIDITDRKRPVVRAKTDRAEAAWLSDLPRERPVIVNIGELARADTLTLPSPETDRTYAIGIVVTEHAVEGGLEHRISSTLIARDAAGRRTGELLLYRGTRFESVHQLRPDRLHSLSAQRERPARPR